MDEDHELIADPILEEMEIGAGPDIESAVVMTKVESGRAAASPSVDTADVRRLGWHASPGAQLSIGFRLP